MQQKYIHLNQMYETESKSKWTYLAQIEELSNEVKTLREEVLEFLICIFGFVSIKLYIK